MHVSFIEALPYDFDHENKLKLWGWRLTSKYKKFKQQKKDRKLKEFLHLTYQNE